MPEDDQTPVTGDLTELELFLIRKAWGRDLLTAFLSGSPATPEPAPTTAEETSDA